MIVFGQREVTRAIEAGVKLDELFISDSFGEAQLQNLVPALHSSTRKIRLPENLFSKLAYGDRTEGLIATAFRPTTNLDSLNQKISEPMLVFVLQAIEKPGNLGAIIRSADGAGVSAIILADPLTDFFHPNSIRSSTGTVFEMPLARCSTVEAQTWLANHQFKTLTAVLENSVDFFDSDLNGNIAIVLGNEANGLDGQWLGDGFIPVKLPMQGRADSLNVSVTASIMAYEAMRQRNK